MSVSITPTLATSKILVLCTIGFCTQGDGFLQLLRDSTAIALSISGSSHNGYAFMASGLEASIPMCINFIDDPNTTSSTTYKIQGRVFQNPNNFAVNRRVGDTLFGGTSTITAIELAVGIL